MGADLLYRREAEDPELHGLLSLSTYSVAPAANHGTWISDGGVERVFPSTDEAGIYNALRSLLADPAAEAQETGVHASRRGRDSTIRLSSRSAPGACARRRYALPSLPESYEWRHGRRAKSPSAKGCEAESGAAA
jgi:hypothetical protein